MIANQEDIRWERRFTNYKKALGQLRKFVEKGDLSELEMQGLVKAFEYTFELAWNTLKDFLEYQDQANIYGSRDAIRMAFNRSLIEDGETWMQMLQSRNLTSHTYNEEVADEICRKVIGSYYALFLQLNKKLDQLRTDL